MRRDSKPPATEPAADGPAVPEEVAEDSGENGRGDHSPTAAAPPTGSMEDSDEITQDLTDAVRAEVAQAEVAQLEDRWRRALAELDNQRKRCARDLDAARVAEQVRVMTAWLPVIDNLDLALAHAGENAENLVEGVRAVRDQAVDLLNVLGYPRDEEIGVRFDPSRHEALNIASGTGVAPGTVMAVARPGYGLGDRQLRPASVVVAGQDG